MSRGGDRARFPRKTVGIAALLLLFDLVGARVLDALGVVEGLLSPSGERLLWLLPLGVGFYAARLAVLFLAPGLVLGSVTIWLWERRIDKR